MVGRLLACLASCYISINLVRCAVGYKVSASPVVVVMLALIGSHSTCLLRSSYKGRESLCAHYHWHIIHLAN